VAEHSGVSVKYLQAVMRGVAGFGDKLAAKLTAALGVQLTPPEMLPARPDATPPSDTDSTPAVKARNAARLAILRQWMADQDRSPAWVSRQIGLHRAAIAELLRGGHPMSNGVAKRLATLLGVPITDYDDDRATCEALSAARRATLRQWMATHQRGLSWVSRISGMQSAYLSQILAGKTQFTNQAARRLTAALGIGFASIAPHPASEDPTCDHP
jgi:transcriptional regulator with XRE-family HTH domain